MTLVVGIFQSSDHRLLCADEVGKRPLRKPGLRASFVDHLGDAGIECRLLYATAKPAVGPGESFENSYGVACLFHGNSSS
jgi:hypothetical protein